jgi:hypothetical protein
VKLEELYRKYKHHDRILSDKTLFDTLVCHYKVFPGNMLYELWQAIKEEAKKRGWENGEPA